MSLLSGVVLAWSPAPPPAGTPWAGYPWLYLRGGQPVDGIEPYADVIAVGDVMLGRAVASGPDPLDGVAGWLRAADLAVGNLECVLAAGGEPRPGPYRLRADPSAAGLLRAAGFDVLALANNHSLDYGRTGLAETAVHLAAAGIAAVGAGPDTPAADQPVVRTVRGVRLAFLAFNAVPDPDGVAPGPGWTIPAWDPARAAGAVARAGQQADAVIVSLHWGYEYERRADPAQRAMAAALLDAGADLVIGHHPHVVQDTLARDGTFVAYSLGNLVFDQEQGDTRQGMALRAVFDARGLRAVQALPVWAGPRPRPMEPGEAASLLARVQPPAPRLGYLCDGPREALCRPVDVSREPASGVLRAGEIDLTGDGLAEQVQLLAGHLTVYENGRPAWRSPAEWRVVDAALGDPNDDGRAEMLVALFKPDAKGIERSHPFIVGYRGGIYRIIWGGSAVAQPIREVELGDVDGDGVQEMVVLDDQPGGTAVSVWRWHGWGFSLVWRSPAGQLRDLALAPAGAAGLPAIDVTAGP